MTNRGTAGMLIVVLCLLVPWITRAAATEEGEVIIKPAGPGTPAQQQAVILDTPPVARRYPDNLFAINQMRIDSVRSPKGIDAFYLGRNEQQVTSSVAKYTGLRDNYISLAKSAKPAAVPKGEETTYSLPVPSGYKLCAIRMDVISLAPASGDRASYIDSVAGPNGFGAYTWTGQQGLGGGKSWVEADVQMLAILPEYLEEFRQKGVCGDFSQDRGLVKCRGNPCLSKAIGKIEEIGASTPDIRALPTIAWTAKSTSVQSPVVWTTKPLPAQFVTLPIPDIDTLRACKNAGDFYGCVVGQAFPKEYRIVRNCIDSNHSDNARAFVCSTGRQDLMDGYDKAKRIQTCARRAKDDAEVALCVGQETLGKRELHYARCAVNNRRDVTQAVVCGLSPDLSPEQQIALSCAVQTGGVPKLYAACTGGKLLERELDKCLQYGIATDQGCLGPNNTIRQYWNSVDDIVKRGVGDNSVAYQAFRVMKDAHVPGRGNEFVKAFNTAQNDLRNGPGRGNDGYRAIEAVGGALQSAGDTVGGWLGW